MLNVFCTTHLSKTDSIWHEEANATVDGDPSELLLSVGHDPVVIADTYNTKLASTPSPSTPTDSQV